ncbi:hypothetical protein GCM10010912_45050 [Paenibacillus albidus]|uniref:BIG2 domain-containing protein n=1 Tax=Paenibacillus albidus TaxID=2041023 RepID=A0A917FPQ6_9BACL|nr:Ig-like domain-containing protein [Paenibacillus albidus]GGF95111.1 hypothetical protein GCM10010912_45050 [Paenibacillus albidus]
MKTYRQAYVKPTWGLATEVIYNRVDNWIEDIPVALRWQSAAPDSLFRINADQGDNPIGNYDQPENHRIMQDGKAAVGVYKSLSAPNATDNYLNAMFPDTGSILNRTEQAGWVFSDTGEMYFAFKMIKPYAWYHQTPTDPANKVKTTTQLHPTKQLYYSYNILRSQADKNGWVLEAADAAEYADFASFRNAVLANATVDSSHTWSSDHPSVAAVSTDGKVTAAVPGTATITATTEDGSYTASCLVTVILEPLFEDSFAGGLASWDFFGSTAWSIQGSGTEALLTGSTTLTGPQRAVVKAAALPYRSQDYSLSFTAEADRFRTMFRYTSGTSFYFLEFKNTSIVELRKYPNASTPVQVGIAVDIAAVLPGFNLEARHPYKVEVLGSEYKLYIDDVLVAAFTDADLTAGGIGFALKSAGPAVHLLVDQVVVMPRIATP